jgi:hypothetical protein
VILPATVNTAVAVKFTLLTLLLVSVTGWFAGVNMKPVLLGVTVYDPAGRLPKLNLPDESAVTVALTVPVSDTVLLAPLAAGLMVPEMLKLLITGGLTSTSARSYLSVVGATSSMVTTVPLAGVVAPACCTQKVSPTGERYW